MDVQFLKEKNMGFESLRNGTKDGDMDRICKTFANKIILVTGGTGFLGKVLVEKLLRKCPEIKNIILLVRAKKGKNPKQRVEEMFQGPLFSKLLTTLDMSTIMSKVTAVAGDTGLEDLALNADDRKLCQMANIIVHSAATVRFDEGLKKAILLNTRSTRCMLDLAKECKNLDLFLHISTAYCHPEQPVLEERLYPPPGNARDLIEAVETLSDEDVVMMTPKLLCEFPNTYAYSKALAESLVEDAMAALPIMILRPSVVIPIYKEPLPGWTDNLNGPVGMFIGAGKGVIRTMYGDDGGHADFIPVDCVVNVLMAATWDYLENGHHPKVINLTTSAEIKVSWKDLIDLGRNIATHKLPLDNVVWYPGGCMTKYRWLHSIKALFFHWLPALFIDILLLCLGYKPVLLRVQRRISNGFEVFEYYTNNQWDFKSDAVQELRKKLSTHEREAYKMDAEGVNLADYFELSLLAARRYILKEKDEDIPKAMRHMKMMKFFYYMSNTIIRISLVYVFLFKIVPIFL